MLNPDKFSKILTFLFFIKVVLTVGKSLSILYPEHILKTKYGKRIMKGEVLLRK